MLSCLKTSLVITGTPLLGEQQLLDTYSYLTDSALYLKQPNEGDADAMARMLSKGADEVSLLQLYYIPHQCALSHLLKPYTSL